MKTVFLIAGLMALQQLSAQELGVRLGNVAGGNAAVDAVFSSGPVNRIHASLAFGNRRAGVEINFNLFHDELGEENFFWYLGVGGSTQIRGNEFLFGPNGEIGLEYRFKTAPISLSGDWRPRYWLLEDTRFDAGGFGLNVRYMFGKGRR